MGKLFHVPDFHLWSPGPPSAGVVSQICNLRVRGMKAPSRHSRRLPIAENGPRERCPPDSRRFLGSCQMDEPQAPRQRQFRLMETGV